jgi:hypothetical protein
MQRTLWVGSMMLMLLPVCIASGAGQDSTSEGMSAKAVVPTVVSYSGTLIDENGKPLTTITGVTFFLYKDQEGGAPLWMETQNVRPDRNGRYTVMLGAMTRGGLQSDLFATGEARWLGIQAQGQSEQARIMLLAVPYALKAADAETVGGLPASAFVLAAPAASGVVNSSAAPPSSSVPTAASAVQPASAAVITSGVAGNVGTIALFSTATDIEKSLLTQTGTMGINVLGKLNLPTTGTASASGGKASRPEVFIASAFNSGTGAAVAQNFQLQADPANNNSASPSGTLSLLYSAGTATPAETGFKINSNGRLTFAPGQTFPGAGTVSSVALSAPAADFSVSGSPVTKTGTLALAWKVPPTNLDTANAIVKRDSTGSFNANNITSTGQVSVTNASSLNPILSQASAANAAAIVGFSTGTGLTDGVLGSTRSSGLGSSGVIGIDQNSNGSAPNYTAGVTGVTQNSFGVGVLGYGIKSGSGAGILGMYRVGVWGDDTSGAGVVGMSDTGNAVLAVNNSTIATALLAKNTGTGSAALADNTSATSATMVAQNRTSATNGLIFQATAPNVLSNGSPAFCQVTTHGDMGCTGDVYQNNPANGLVKALLFFDPGQPAGHLKIVRCFNSALAEPAASTPPCGFTYSNLDVGINQIDFGFPVTNRFPQITAGIEVGVNNFNGVIGVFYFPVGGASSQLEVWTILGSSNNRIDAPFSLSIF